MPRSKLLAFALAVGLTTLFLTAGVWQLRRAAYKEHLQQTTLQGEAAPELNVSTALLDPATANLRRVVAHGHWIKARSILLDNKFNEGEVGYEVVTPLQLAGSEYVMLVNRGWIKASLNRSELPNVPAQTGEVVVSGLARVPTNRFLELGSENIVGSVWQNLTIARFAAWSGMKLQPAVLYQSGADSDGLRRVQPAPEAMGINADRHRGYALTWFSLAVVTIVLSVFAWRKSKKHQD